MIDCSAYRVVREFDLLAVQVDRHVARRSIVSCRNVVPISGRHRDRRVRDQRFGVSAGRQSQTQVVVAALVIRTEHERVVLVERTIGLRKDPSVATTKIVRVDPRRHRDAASRHVDVTEINVATGAIKVRRRVSASNAGRAQRHVVVGSIVIASFIRCRRASRFTQSIKPNRVWVIRNISGRTCRIIRRDGCVVDIGNGDNEIEVSPQRAVFSTINNGQANGFRAVLRTAAMNGDQSRVNVGLSKRVT